MKGKSRSKKQFSKQDLMDVLVKKALGYDAKEVVEEYVGGEEGDVKLSKKKITIKYVPPDMTALKILLDENQQQVCEMTDEQLEIEKNRLLSLLKEIQND